MVVTSALGYVPETPWNETCVNPLTLSFQQLIFGTGNAYVGSDDDNHGVGDTEEGCNALLYDANELEEFGGVYAYSLNLLDNVGGSGGASNCVASTTTETTVGACSTGATTTGPTNNPGTNAAQAALTLVNNGWAKPTWQTGVQGIPSDGVRDMPDVSFFASDGFVSSSAYLICVSEASSDPECSYSSSVEPFAQEVGGTSVATPAMAAVMALINQKTGESQGLATPELYKLAAGQSYGACSAEIIANNPTTANNCFFYDIDTGTNAMPCDYDYESNTPSPDCTVIHSFDYVGSLSGYPAGKGYDQATGLGSLNVANVVNAWPQTLGAGNATITITPAETSLNSSNTLNVTVTLTSNPSGGVTPTGAVTLTASGSTYTQTVNSSTGSYSFTIPANSLSGSAAGMVDTLTASYVGDSVYLASSNTTTVTVTTVTGGLLIPVITVAPASATLNSGGSLSVVVTVAGTGVTPTGTVTLSGAGYNSPSETLASGTYTFTIPANTLASGPDVLTANYGGDGNYAAGSNTATVTVTESSFTLTPVVTPATIAPGASAAAVVTVAATSGYTGTVTLTCQQTGGPSTGDGTSCTLAGGAAVTLTSGTTSGTVTFSVATAAPVAAVTYPQIRKNGWAGAGTGAVLAVLMLVGIPARRKSWRQMLGVLVLMAALGGLAGCGSSSTSGGTGGTGDPGTAAGTYTYTVQATGNPSVTPAVTTTFNVVVN